MADLQWNRSFALEQAGGDRDLLIELLELLRTTTAADLARIKAALTGQDAGTVGLVAHSIKGAAASLGFDGLAELALRIENFGSSGDLSGADAFLADLERLIKALPAE